MSQTWIPQPQSLPAIPDMPNKHVRYIRSKRQNVMCPSAINGPMKRNRQSIHMKLVLFGDICTYANISRLRPTFLLSISFFCSYRSFVRSFVRSAPHFPTQHMWWNPGPSTHPSIHRPAREFSSSNNIHIHIHISFRANSLVHEIGNSWVEARLDLLSAISNVEAKIW